MKNIIFGSLFFITLLCFSCKENEALEYVNDPALYFVNDKKKQMDSLNHSFFTVPGNGPDTVYVLIHTMGYVYDFDRPFTLEQTNAEEENAAIAGVHYVPFDDAQVSKYFVIPANQAEVKLPIILLRDKSLESNIVRLELGFVQNEYFRPGINEWTKFLVKTTAQTYKPNLWDTYWKFYFGSSWGSVKMKFIIDVTGFTEWEKLPTDHSITNFLLSKVLNKFHEYNEANPGNLLREADGTLVSFTN